MQDDQSITGLLRQAMTEDGAPSLYRIAKACGLQKSSLGRFVKGEQSLRLDLADKLAEYLGIECRRVRRRKDD